MISTAEFNTLDKLSELQLLWNSLWQRTPRASFFQTLEWYRCWCRHAGPAVRPRALVPSLAGQPLGIVPLAVVEQPTSVGSVRILSYPELNGLPLGGPVGPNRTATLVAAVRHLRATPRDWDVIDLAGGDRGRTSNALRLSRLGVVTEARRSLDEIRFERGWMDYWAHRPLSLRRRFHRADRLLSSSGVRFVRFRPDVGEWDAAVDSGVEQLLAAHRDRPAGRNDAPHSSHWYGELYRAAIETGTADVCLLFAGCRPLAVACNVWHDRAVENLFSIAAVDAHRQASIVLLGRMLQDGAARGDSSYRMRTATLDPFGRWRTGFVSQQRHRHFALTSPAAQWMHLKARLRGWLSDPATEPPQSPPARHVHLHRERRVSTSAATV